MELFDLDNSNEFREHIQIEREKVTRPYRFFFVS